MEMLMDIKKRLEEVILCELNKGIENVDCEEMYKACDMLKDVADACYHCALIDAMEDAEYGKDYDENGAYRYYTRPHSSSKRNSYPHMYYDDMADGEYENRMSPKEYRRIEDMTHGRMYYTEQANNSNTPYDMRMGRSGEHRRRYFESKEHNDNNAKMQSLEEYAKSLTEDVTEMIRDASDNEKQMLRTKMQMLIQKI